jgi:hypothetical protein
VTPTQKTYSHGEKHINAKYILTEQRASFVLLFFANIYYLCLQQNICCLHIFHQTVKKERNKKRDGIQTDSVDAVNG